MATSCLGMRLEHVKAKAEKASVLLGHKGLTDYVVSIPNENSTKIIVQYKSMTVENDVFKRFGMSTTRQANPIQR